MGNVAPPVLLRHDQPKWDIHHHSLSVDNHNRIQRMDPSGSQMDMAHNQRHQGEQLFRKQHLWLNSLTRVNVQVSIKMQLKQCLFFQVIPTLIINSNLRYSRNLALIHHNLDSTDFSRINRYHHKTYRYSQAIMGRKAFHSHLCKRAIVAYPPPLLPQRITA